MKLPSIHSFINLQGIINPLEPTYNHGYYSNSSNLVTYQSLTIIYYLQQIFYLDAWSNNGLKVDDIYLCATYQFVNQINICLFYK